MSEGKRNLVDSLIDLHGLGVKYGFSNNDWALLTQRCICLGEACAFLHELGLWEEFEERFKKKLKKIEEDVLKDVR